MLLDKFARKIDYLRISVTDRCNLRCVYCMPECGIEEKSPADILTYEEIGIIVNSAVSLGINKIRITGGEPLVRKDIIKLVASLAEIQGIKDLSLTTNGVLLERYALQLKNAGLQRINISLDTLDDAKFSTITRTGAFFPDVLRGIDAAKNAGLAVKLNVVLMEGINTEEVLNFVRFGRENALLVRFIEFMPTLDNQERNKFMYVPSDEISQLISSRYPLEPITGVFGNGPARYFRLKESGNIIGFISALSCKFCRQCNRLRLTSDGFLLSCLAHTYGVDLKNRLRAGASREEILKLIKEAVSLKPKEHVMELNKISGCMMSQVGG